MAGGRLRTRWRWRNQLPPVRAARLTRLRRRALRRAGFTDGRAGKPNFTLALPGVTTAVRVGIEREMLAQIAAVQQIYGEWSADTERELTEAATRLDSVQAELLRKRAEVIEVEKKRPTSPAERRRGETHQREEIVLGRRLREFEGNNLAPLVARIVALVDEEEAQLSNRDKAAGRLAAIDKERERVERWIFTLQLHARSIYDEALVKRHPFGDHLRPLLDGATLNLPPWPLPDWLKRPPTTEEQDT